MTTFLQIETPISMSEGWQRKKSKTHREFITLYFLLKYLNSDLYYFQNDTIFKCYTLLINWKIKLSVYYERNAV